MSLILLNFFIVAFKVIVAHIVQSFFDHHCIDGFSLVDFRLCRGHLSSCSGWLSLRVLFVDVEGVVVGDRINSCDLLGNHSEGTLAFLIFFSPN